jgi:glycosyltransferase involved in cell wall biosynthesis
MSVLEPVRVLHLCAGNLYGGVERIVSECAVDRALCPGMLPSFGVCFEGRLTEEIDAAGAPCVRLGAARFSRPWTVLRARRRLAALLKEQSPDVVVCHSSWMYGIAAPVVRRAVRPLVLWLHNRVSGDNWPERRAAGTHPDLIIANSRFTGESVALLYPGAGYSVLYAPVRADVSGVDRVRLRAAMGVDPDTPVILMASRFEACKGHHALLAAVAQVPAPWQLWIAGKPQRNDEEAYERDLRQLAIASGIGDRVRFIGERRDVAACMRAADIHCQPNTAPESFGLTFVEALYAGLPVVTTAMGGAVEILTDACGVLVPASDSAALTNALRRLVMDPDAGRRLGSNGPSRARELCDPARQLASLALLAGAAAERFAGVRG